MPSAAFLSYTSFLLCFSNCFKEKWSASYSFKYFGFFPYSSSCLICSRTDWLELGKIVHCEFAFQLVDAGKCKLKCCCAVVFHSIILFFYLFWSILLYVEKILKVFIILRPFFLWNKWHLLTVTIKQHLKYHTSSSVLEQEMTILSLVC